MNKIKHLVPDLCRSAARGGIGYSPRCLLPCAEFCLLKNLNQYREDVGINHTLVRGTQQSNTSTCLETGNMESVLSSIYLNLSSVSSRDIRHGPAGLLFDRFLGTAEQVE